MIETKVKATPEMLALQRQLDARVRQAALEQKAGPGRLIEVIEPDRAGRQISKFYGDPDAAFGAFKIRPKRVIGFNTK